jgi:hypothetical protein
VSATARCRSSLRVESRGVAVRRGIGITGVYRGLVGRSRRMLVRRWERIS